MAHEIEEALDEFAGQGCTIRKLSILGYSLGGLIGRYAVGLLYSRGYFDRIQPVNFTTFATPHVGVRSPARRSHFWNVLGARTVSKSGRQLFMIDNFRDTGQPLLSILAAKGSIFMLGLTKFQSRSLYANIINDRAAVFYTTGISKTDPFVHLDKIVVNCIPGYSPVIIDADDPVRPPDDIVNKSHWWHLSHSVKSSISGLPFFLFICVFVPIAVLLYLINSAVQTARSRRRIRLHEEGKLGVPLSTYKVPLIVEEMRSVVEEMYETVNATREPEYLDTKNSEDDKPAEAALSPWSDNRSSEGAVSYRPQAHRAPGATKSSKAFAGASDSSSAAASHCDNNSDDDTGIEKRRGCCYSNNDFPTLALTPAQFAIVDNLNSVGFRKYPVHIHNARHSHAAIIVRMPRKSFDEGKVVIRHWLEEEFRL